MSAVAAWIMKLLPVLLELINEAVKATQPPTTEELRDRLIKKITESHADWLTEARAAADKALVESAAKEFSEGLKEALKDKE